MRDRFFGCVSRVATVSCLLGSSQLISGQGFGAVVDSFTCTTEVKDSQAGGNTASNIVSFETIRKKINVSFIPPNVTMFQGHATQRTTLETKTGQLMGKLSFSYFVAELRNSAGEIQAAKLYQCTKMRVGFKLGEGAIETPMTMCPLPRDPFNPENTGHVPGIDLDVRDGKLPILDSDSFNRTQLATISDLFNIPRGQASSSCKFHASILTEN